MTKRLSYQIAFALLILWAGLMAWDMIWGLPDMNSQLRNMLTWFPSLVIGFVWAFSSKAKQ